MHPFHRYIAGQLNKLLRERRVGWSHLVECQRLAGARRAPQEEPSMKNPTRITVNPHQMSGMPCIRGLRIPVATVVAMVADRMSDEEILEAYPDLEPEDIRQALHFAALAVQERELPLAVAS